MTFTQSIATCFSKYASFAGRASRSEYWWFVLFLTCVDVLIGFIEGFEEGGILSNVWTLATFLPFLAVAWRRMHDTDRSGAWCLLPFVPVVLLTVMILSLPYGAAPGAAIWILGLIALGTVILTLVWFATRGTDGPNQYGEDPLT